MKLRVRPHDRAEAPFEATVLTRIQTSKFMGSTVPVWYDPNDHSRVVVDYEADVSLVLAASGLPAALITAFVTCMFGLLWFVLPLARRR